MAKPKKIDKAAKTSKGISQSALDRFRVKASPKTLREFKPFSLPTPPPGVIPAANKLAMDQAHDSFFQYATGEQLWSEGIGFMGYSYLAQLSQRPEYRRIAETLARESTRKWIEFEASGDKNKTKKVKQLTGLVEKQGLRAATQLMVALDGYFGRAHLYADTGATDDPAVLQTPLVIDKRTIKKGSLKGFTVVEPMWTYPNDYNTIDALSPDFYRPRNWWVMGKLVHATRLATMVARPVPDLLKATYAFGGLALTQMAKPYVDEYLVTKKSVTDLVHMFSTKGLKTNLGDMLNGGAAQDADNRARCFEATADNRNMMLLDKDTEEFFNVSTPLTTLDVLTAQTMERLGFVCGYPMVVLLGISPAGLNASSEGEIRVWENFVHAFDEAVVRPIIQWAVEIIQISTWGEIDEDITFKFVKLHDTTEKEDAEIDKMEADADQVRIDSGVISPDEAREALAGQEHSRYSGLDLNSPAPEPPEDDLDTSPNQPDGKAQGPGANTGERRD